MVSKLDESSEDASARPMAPDSPDQGTADVAVKTVFWQPKISGSVKNRISSIETHNPPPFVPTQQYAALSKRPLSQSTQDLSSQSSSNGARVKFLAKFPSLQEQVDYFEKAKSDEPQQVLRDGKWCPAVVSKPYCPRTARCLPKLMRSKTLPAVYSAPAEPPAKTGPAPESPQSPPPWLLHLKSRGLQQRPPWWSRANSIDESGGAGLAAWKSAAAPASPDLNKRTPAAAPLSPFSVRKQSAPPSPASNKKVSLPNNLPFSIQAPLSPAANKQNRFFSTQTPPASPALINRDNIPSKLNFPMPKAPPSPSATKRGSIPANLPFSPQKLSAPRFPTANKGNPVPATFLSSVAQPAQSSPTLNKRGSIPTSLPFTARAQPAPEEHPPKKCAAPIKLLESPKSPKPFRKVSPMCHSANFAAAEAVAANSPPQTNGIVTPVKPPTPSQQPPRAVSAASPRLLPKSSALAQPPLRLDSKLEELHQRFSFINKDTVFDVSLNKNSRGLGIRIYGGRDQDPANPLAIFIRIKRLYPLQPALECGRLDVGDVILAVNGRHLTGLSHSEAVDVLRIAPSSVALLLCRPSPNTLPPLPQDGGLPNNGSAQHPSVIRLLNLENKPALPPPSPKDFDVVLVKVGRSLGFTLHKKEEYHHQHGHFIKELVKDPALTDGRLQPGDQILKVNGTAIGHMSHTEAIGFLRTCSSEVTLAIHRSGEVASSPLSPLSPLVSFHPQDVSNSVRSDKKILRKEAQDLLSDSSRRKCGETGSDTFGSPKSRRRRRKGNSSPSTLSAGSTTSDTIENFSSDAESQRSSPTPSFNGLVTAGKSNSFSTLQSGVSRESSLSSMSNGSSVSLFKVARPSFLSLNGKQASFDDPVRLSGSAAPDCGAQTHLPALRVSKYESDGTTTSTTEDTDSDSSGAVCPPRLEPVEEKKEPPPQTQMQQSNGAYEKSNCVRDSQECESHKLFQKLQFFATSDDTRSGLMKWRGTVLSPVGPAKELPPTPTVELVQQDTLAIDLNRSQNSRLGFSLIFVEIGKLKGSFVRVVHPDGVASQDGRLKPGDHLLKINSISIENTQTDEVIELLRNLHGKIVLYVRRNPVVTNSVLNILRLQST